MRWNPLPAQQWKCRQSGMAQRIPTTAVSTSARACPIMHGLIPSWHHAHIDMDSFTVRSQPCVSSCFCHFSSGCLTQSPGRNWAATARTLRHHQSCHACNRCNSHHAMTWHCTSVHLVTPTTVKRKALSFPASHQVLVRRAMCRVCMCAGSDRVCFSLP